MRKVTISLVLRLGIFFSICLSLASAQAQTTYRGVVLSPDATSQDIDDLGAFLHPNVVRYQLFWQGPVDSANTTDYAAWLETALDQFEALLPSFQSNGLKVVLDLHTPPGGFASYKPRPQHRVFAQQSFQDALVQSWQTIATRFNGNDTIWAYDLLNEPAQPKVTAGLKDWNALAPLLVQAIRAIDANRTIIVKPIYADPGRMKRLKPLTAGNIVYSVHFYYPIQFAHQGLPGHKRKIKYPNDKYNKKALRDNLRKVFAFQKKNNAQIFVGEFSAVRWARDGSAYRYLRDLISIFESKHWSWAYHAWRENDAWSVEHGTDPDDHAPSGSTTDRAQLLISYFENN